MAISRDRSGSCRVSMPRVLAGLVVAMGVLGATAVVAQSPSTEVGAPRPKICILGASVSDGFINPFGRADGEPDSTVKLRTALAAVWSDEAADVVDRSSTTTFMRPLRVQRSRVESTVADRPDLVLAVDYPFWFGYGYARGDDPGALRLAEQRGGLELLEALEGPVLVGDYPLVRGADARMLQPAMIPAEADVARLNAALRTWADARDNVHVFPLAAFFDRTFEDGGLTVTDGERTVFVPRDALLQGDGLHPSRVGVAILAQAIAEQLRAVLPAEHALYPTQRPLRAYLEAARATVEWELVLEQAAAGAGDGEGDGEADRR